MIETTFPIVEVSRLAKLESYRKNIYRPPYYIHKWWARRVGTTFRAILLSALLPEGSSFEDAFYSSHDFGDFVVLDPFMGGGTTVGEAVRLGCRVVGSDINPVAWFLVGKAVEDVRINDLDSAVTELEMTIAPSIRDLYVTACDECGQAAEAIYTYWVKRIPCMECAEPVELRTSYVLASYAQDHSKGLVCCPNCGDLNIASGIDGVINCPNCDQAFEPNAGNSRGSWYRCTNCHHKGQIIDVMRVSSQPPDHKMVGMFYACPDHGRMYKGAGKEDLRRFNEIEERVRNCWDKLLIPRSEIPAGYNTDQMRRYNYSLWTDMFNARQLFALSTLLEGIKSLSNQSAKEYLTLLTSSLLEFNSMFAAAKGLGTGAVRHVFAHHAFIPQKEPLETNLWGAVRASGTFATLYEERLRRGKAWSANPLERRIVNGKVEKVPIEGERLAAKIVGSWDELKNGKDVLLLNSSSDSLPIPDESVDLVVTDPPYFDNVMYSELADYFYVWLRLVLSESHPEFRPEHVERSAEVIRNERQGKDSDFYADGLARVFRECRRVLKAKGLMIFTFHHGSSEAWNAVEHALVTAGFSVETFHPVHSEMDVAVPIQGKNGIKFDVVFVCRKSKFAERRVDDLGTYVDQLAGVLENEFSVSDSDRAILKEAARVMESTWASVPTSEHVSLR